MFPITVEAWSRLRRNWHLLQADYHLFEAIKHLNQMGQDGDEAADALKKAFIYKFPLSPPSNRNRS